MDGRRSALGAYLMAVGAVLGHVWRGLATGVAILAGALLTAGTLLFVRLLLYLDDLSNSFR